MDNISIAVSVVMIVALFINPSGMLTVCSLSALAVLVLAGSGARDILTHAAPNAITILVVMSTTQLAILKFLRGGAGERVAEAMARLAANRWLRGIPASLLIPAIFVPAAMLMAMFLHNITAILVLTPLELSLCVPYKVRPGITLSAMLIASNLGGASMAFGDTPAIIQRELWGFGPGTFAVAMLPRNLLVLIPLTMLAAFFTWFPNRRQRTDWADTSARLKARDYYVLSARYGSAERLQAAIGAIALLTFIGLQFAFPHHALVTGSAVLAMLILCTPKEHRIDGYTALGLDAIVVICSLFVVASGVEHTPFVANLATFLNAHRGSGAIEIVAYGLTSAISADGAAATLGPVVHQMSSGSLLSAWQLACGICAGSSTLLTAASAGPIINTVSRNAGHELTFRDYSRFGFPFSLLMMAIYLAVNMLTGR